jgi:hypothetical protein
MIITIVVLALSVGWGAVATLLSEELEDVANAVGSLNQSFNYVGIQAKGHASCSGGGFNDTPSSVNVTTSFPNFSGLIPNIQGQTLGGQGAQAVVPNNNNQPRAFDAQALQIPVELVEIENVIGTDAMTRLINGTSIQELVLITRNIGPRLLTETIIELGITRTVEVVNELRAESFSEAVRDANPNSPFDPNPNGVRNGGRTGRDGNQAVDGTQGADGGDDDASGDTNDRAPRSGFSAQGAGGHNNKRNSRKGNQDSIQGEIDEQQRTLRELQSEILRKRNELFQ